MKTIKSIILASISPRRKELLAKTGIEFKIVESGLKEHFNLKLKPSELAKNLSLEKAKEVCKKNKKSIIIAADTLVVCRGKILGKPRNEKDAKAMLKFLSGKMHQVITGFTILDTTTNKLITRAIKTKVYFNKISQKDISEYTVSKKPFDKAGAYGIQELPGNFIKKIEGDYDNIVGLPVYALVEELKKFGVKV